MRAHPFAVVVAIVLATPALAAAQKRTPRPSAAASEGADPREPARRQALAHLTEGNALFARGAYLPALDRFRSAYAAYPSPGLHFNIAQALYALGRPLEALTEYEVFLRDVAQDERTREERQIAKERVIELQQKVSSIVVQSNVTDALVSIDADAIGSTPLVSPVRVLPGKHVIIVAKPGFEQRVVGVELAGGATTTERVQLLTEAEATRRRREFQAEEQRRRVAEQRLRREREAATRRTARNRRVLRITGWSAASVGIAGGVAAATFGGLSWHESEQLADLPAGSSWADDARVHHDRAETYRSAFLVSAGVGVVGLTAGAVLLWKARGLTDRQTTEAARAALVPSWGGGLPGVAVVGRF